MEYALRLFLMMFVAVLRKRWYVVLIPMISTVIHGAYTGNWYILYGIALSLVVAVLMALHDVAMKPRGLRG